MIQDLLATVLICSCVGYAIGSALYIWRRLRTVERDQHLTSWDLEALAGALRKREENETSERPNH